MDDEALRQYIDEIHAVDMEDVCNMLGIATNRSRNTLQVLCPFHNDQHFGSCVVKNGYLKCFACGESADSIKLVQHVLGENFMEACKTIADIAGIEAPKMRPRSENERRMPLNDTQLQLLGLQKRVSAFVCEGYTDDPTVRTNHQGTFQFDEDGYVLGRLESLSLYQLFVEDEVTFNMIVIGKLFERLMDDISTYLVHQYGSEEEQQQTEKNIEMLIPVASYYRSVAPGYGYRFDFIDQYHKKPLYTLSF